MRFINVDFSLVKEIAITEKKRLQFLAEAFNVFNHMVLWACLARRLRPRSLMAPSATARPVSSAASPAGTRRATCNWL
jgi:hypothetical protein